MQRDDLSSNLVHLTKVDLHKWNKISPDYKREMENEAFYTLLKILKEKMLISNNGKIKGGHKCVCFSETPLNVLQQLFSNTHKDIKYRPFGIVFQKKYIFDKGGRPVIYQPLEDYEKLSLDKMYLHMTFDLSRPSPIDFTWEREWRYRDDDGINLTSTEAKVLVPNQGIRDLIGRYLRETTISAEDPWDYIILDQYNINVPVHEVSLPDS